MTQPTLANIMAMRERLGFSIDWLIAGSDPESKRDMRTKRLMDIYGRLDERGRDAVFRVAESESAYVLDDGGLRKNSA